MCLVLTVVPGSVQDSEQFSCSWKWPGRARKARVGTPFKPGVSVSLALNERSGSCGNCSLPKSCLMVPKPWSDCQKKAWLPNVSCHYCWRSSVCLPPAYQISFYVLLAESKSPPEAWWQGHLEEADTRFPFLATGKSIGGGGNGLWVTVSSLVSCWRQQRPLHKACVFFFLKYSLDVNAVR